MYKSCEELADRCAKEEGGAEMAGHLHEQAFGLRKARMMLGTMLDEQAGHVPATAHVHGVSDMPPLLQGAMSKMIVLAVEAMERGDFNDQNAAAEGHSPEGGKTT